MKVEVFISKDAPITSPLLRVCNRCCVNRASLPNLPRLKFLMQKLPQSWAFSDLLPSASTAWILIPRHAPARTSALPAVAMRESFRPRI